MAKGLYSVLGRACLRTSVGALFYLCFLLTVAAAEPLSFRPDRVLIVPKSGAQAKVARLQKAKGHRMHRQFEDMGGIQVLELAPGEDPVQKSQEYLASGLVDAAEPDYVIHASATPNDPGYYYSWGLNNTGQLGGKAHADIDAPSAWDSQNSASNIIVAVVDTGARYTHEDLAANMWHNPREIPGNGKDDDGDGIIDDVVGMNAITGSGDPMDDAGHGTHVSGIIGAVGNNGKGVAGVCWKVQIMALKFMDSTGQGDTSDAISCINYARQHGAKVINASWGSTFGSSALRTAISSAKNAGIIFVAAAGNEQSNNDLTPSYPASYTLNNIVTVAATNGRDELDTQYSNYGATSVDIAAPGTGIYSTWYGGDSAYQYLSGTSMATPHVTGAIALLCAAYPSDSYSTTISKLYAAVDKLPSLSGKCVTGGRLNIGKLFPRHWTLNTTQVGEGSVTVANQAVNYLDGTSVQVLATAAPGYAFAGWGGDLAGTNNPAAVLLNSNKVVQATFVRVAVEPPRITSVQQAPDGGFTLSLSTTASAQIESSTNLVNWQSAPISAFAVSTNSVEVVPGPGEPFRFYRVRVQ